MVAATSDAATRRELVALIRDELGTDYSEEALNRFPSVDEADWTAKADGVLEVLKRFAK